MVSICTVAVATLVYRQDVGAHHRATVLAVFPDDMMLLVSVQIHVPVTVLPVSAPITVLNVKLESMVQHVNMIVYPSVRMAFVIKTLAFVPPYALIICILIQRKYVENVQIGVAAAQIIQSVLRVRENITGGKNVNMTVLAVTMTATKKQGVHQTVPENIFVDTIKAKVDMSVFFVLITALPVPIQQNAPLVNLTTGVLIVNISAQPTARIKTATKLMEPAVKAVLMV